MAPTPVSSEPDGQVRQANAEERQAVVGAIISVACALKRGAAC